MHSLLLSDIMKLEFYRQIFEKISNFLKILLVGAALVQWDGRTDIMKLIVAFHNFANAPKIINSYLIPLYELHEGWNFFSIFGLPYLLFFRPEWSALFISVPPQPITISAVCANSTLYRCTTTTVPPHVKERWKRNVHPVTGHEDPEGE